MPFIADNFFELSVLKIETMTNDIIIYIINTYINLRTVLKEIDKRNKYRHD